MGKARGNVEGAGEGAREVRCSEDMGWGELELLVLGRFGYGFEMVEGREEGRLDVGVLSALF